MQNGLVKCVLVYNTNMDACLECKQDFSVLDSDNTFYDKISVPAPKLCPLCRVKRRMVFRNERNLYRRKCDKCSKDMLAIYKVDASFPVYCYDCWWGEEWDPFAYGQDYAEGRSFFEQFAELAKRVPHLGLVYSHSENCDYTNYINYSKNCYLIFGCHGDEECYYGWRTHDSYQCLDNCQLDKSKFCYECVDCDECYELLFSQDCTNCTSSAFLYDCKSSTDCLFSTGLRNKQYCIFNKQYSREGYLKEKAKYDLSSYEGLEVAKKLFAEFLKSYPRRATFVINSENVAGDHIINSKNIHYSFNLKNAEDGAYLESCEDIKDSMDATFSGWPAELIYECISAGIGCHNQKFSVTTWTCSDVEYCDSCHNSKDLFGCFGLRRQRQYCILNKQYNCEEYEKLRAQIIKDMRLRGEYGEFFPVSMSPFEYDETIAFEFFPPSEQAMLRPKDYVKQTFELADTVVDTKDSVCDEILECIQCSKNYRIVYKELEFYRKFKIALPRSCPDCRHHARMAKRSGGRIWKTSCSECSGVVETTYKAKDGLNVLCEKCYLGRVY
jgi:hypothetical protein